MKTLLKLWQSAGLGMSWWLAEPKEHFLEKLVLAIVMRFLRKFDGNGNEVWTLQFGTPTGNGAAPARGVAVDGSDNIYVAGDTGGLLLGTEPNLGGSDAYVVKIGVSAQGSFEMPFIQAEFGRWDVQLRQLYVARLGRWDPWSDPERRLQPAKWLLAPRPPAAGSSDCPWIAAPER